MHIYNIYRCYRPITNKPESCRLSASTDKYPIISSSLQIIMAATNVSASPVWEYFGFKQDENDNVLPTRKLCLKKVHAAGGNTSNLQRHLQDHHPTESSKIANVHWTFVFVQYFAVIYAVIYNYTAKLWLPALSKIWNRIPSIKSVLKLC